MKVAFVIGHDKASKGAISYHLENNKFNGKIVSEYNFWESFVLKNLLNHGDIFVHEVISSYEKKQISTAQKTKDYDLVFELHFNASNGKAQGVEALYYHKNDKTKSISEKFCQLVSEKMGSKIRGAKPLSSGNGYGFLYHTKQWAVLLEPFFGDNPNDCKKFDEKLFKEVIVETIAYAKKIKGNV